jgi:hypothetical protein
MNCSEYINRFLSADADGQLSAEERHLVDEHLGGCHRCRALLDEELALKASIRSHMGTVRTPADTRLRIRAALGEADERTGGRTAILNRARRSVRNRAARLGARPATAHTASEASISTSARRRWLAIQLKRAQYLAPIGLGIVVLAAAGLVLRINGKTTPGSQDYLRATPAFDFAIARFNELSQEFAPNVPSEAFRRDDGAYFAWVEQTDPFRHVSAELPDISVSYEKMQMLPEFCDFALAGYQLIGGRIDRMANGEPVTFTLYRNQAKSILSIGLKQRLAPPEGGYWFDNHALYSYRGYSICLTIYPNGHFASIIVTRAPMVELLRDVVVSGADFSSR